MNTNSHLPKDTPEDKIFDFKLIKQDLDNLVETFINKIDRTSPLRRIKNADHIISAFVKIAKNIYKTIIYLCATKPVDYKRKKEYIFSTLPLLRVLLEEVFTVVFISEDLDSRIQWYLKAGWREMKEENDRIYKRFKDDPHWQKILPGLGRVVEEGQIELNLTDTEIKTLNKIRYWPIPSRMLNEVSAIETKNLFQFLDDWFYKQFSQSAHISLHGLFQTEVYLSRANENDEMTTYVEKMRALCVFNAVTFILMLLSEIEHILNFNLKTRLAYIWGIVTNYSEDAKKLYEMRYSIFLIRSSNYSPSADGAPKHNHAGPSV